MKNQEINLYDVIRVSIERNQKSSSFTCVVIDEKEDNLLVMELSSAKIQGNETSTVELKPSKNGLKFRSFIDTTKLFSIDSNAKITRYNITLPEKDIQALCKEYEQNSNPVITELTVIDEFDYTEHMVREKIESFEKDPQQLKEFLQFSSLFHQYSLRNTLLIKSQNPHATFVASFSDWKNKFKADIKKGQTSTITVYRPYISTAYLKNDKALPLNKASNEDKQKIANGEYNVIERTKYHTIKLFDISQTTFPKSSYPKLYSMGYEDVESRDLYKIVKEVAIEHSIEVSEKELPSIALHGFFTPGKNCITINSELEDSMKVSAMCHEFAHALLHSTSTAPTEIKEFEAECLSVILCYRFNLQIENNNIAYIQRHYNTIHSHYPDTFSQTIRQSFDRVKKQYNLVSEKTQEKIINDYPEVYEKQLLKEKEKENIMFEESIEVTHENSVPGNNLLWANLKDK